MSALQVRNVTVTTPRYNVPNNLAHLLPDLVPETISMELVGCNEAFANAIRRVFVDELEVKCIYMHLDQMKTNDKRLSDLFIQSRLALVPLNQRVAPGTTFSLYVENKTSAPIPIMMGDFSANPPQPKLVDSKLQLCTLYPNCMLSIKNVGVVSDVGYVDEKYTLGSFKYRVLDANLDVSTVAQDNKHFELALTTNGQIATTDLINDIAANLRVRFKEVDHLLQQYAIQQPNQPVELASRFSPKVFVVLNTSGGMDLHEVHIDGEYHTMGNVLMHYCLEENPDLSIASYKLEHVLSNTIVFSIEHPDYKKIISSAIKRFLTDLDEWQTQVMASIKA